MLDYSDLEHNCLQILLAEHATRDELIPSEVALNYQATFSEVLVDEYQDTNFVQETIVQLYQKKTTYLWLVMSRAFIASV